MLCAFLTILKQTHALQIAITQNMTLHYTLCKKQKQTQQTQNILAVLKRVGTLGVRPLNNYLTDELA